MWYRSRTVCNRVHSPWAEAPIRSSETCLHTQQIGRVTVAAIVESPSSTMGSLYREARENSTGGVPSFHPMACPTLTVLLRRTSPRQLLCSRSPKNPQCIPADTPTFFQGLRGPHLPASPSPLDEGQRQTGPGRSWSPAATRLLPFKRSRDGGAQLGVYLVTEARIYLYDKDVAGHECVPITEGECSDA